jgi:predicted transglutaminase-like protease
MDRDIGYHPTLKELKNKEVIHLSKRLKGESDKETLTNILEWQDKNIYFWTERWPLAPWSLIISLGFLLIFCVAWAAA